MCIRDSFTCTSLYFMSRKTPLSPSHLTYPAAGLGQYGWLAVHTIQHTGSRIDTTNKAYQNCKKCCSHFLNTAILGESPWSRTRPNLSIFNLTERKMRHFFRNPIRVGPCNIIPKRGCKYLGVTLDTNLTWRQHIKKSLTKPELVSDRSGSLACLLYTSVQ